MEWTKAQETAINIPRRDVLVAAAAGSGKTATLTERVLRAITRRDDPTDIDRLLIVTFTEKAAAELKTRIRNKLTEISAKDPDDLRIKRQISLLPSASISTIHAFYGKLVREGAAKLGLPPKLRNIEDDEREFIMHRVMDSVIDSYYEGNKGDGFDIEDADALFDTFEKLRPDESLYRIMRGLYKTAASYPETVGFYKNCADECFAASEDFSSCKYYSFIRQRCCAALNSVIDPLKEMSEEYCDNSMYVNKYLPAAQTVIDNIALINDAFDKGYGTLYDRMANLPKLPQLNGVKGDRPYDSDFKRLREIYTKKTEELKRFCSYDPEDTAAICKKTGVLCDGIYRFLSRFDRAFTEEKISAGVMTFEDMEHYAYRLVCGDPEFARSVAERFDDIYVDEYQDVNGIQDEFFAALGKGRRFMVGDVKQSIYSFRGSDAGIFTSYRNEFPQYTDGAPGPSVLFLSDNFRCGKPIIDFTNEVFSAVFGCGDKVPYEKEDELVFGKQCEKREDVPVTVKLCVGGTVEDEAEYAAKQIKKLLKSGKKDDGTPITLSDIAVLCRKKEICDSVEKVFTANGLPCVNTSDSNLFFAPEILLAVSLLSAIDNPVRDVPLAAAMKSPIFGFTLDELAVIRSQTREGTLYDAVQAYAENENGEKCRAFLKRLNYFRNRARTMQTDKFIRLFYKETSLLSLIWNDCDKGLPENRKSNLLTLYDLARKYESDSFKGLYGFVRYCEEMIENDSSFKTAYDPMGRITVQTIHMSKGLEYPVCFIMNANKQFNTTYNNGMINSDHSLGLGIRVTGDDGIQRVGPIYRAVALKKDSDLITDEACLFYVAATRAKKYLYITASPKTLPKFSKDASALSLAGCRSFLDFLKISLDGSESSCVIVTDDGEAEEAAAENAVSGDAVTDAAKDLSEELLGIYNYEYPYKEAASLPKKAAVSSLFPGYLDKDDEVVDLFEKTEPLPLILPDYSGESGEHDAASRGTATHLFMQFCDLERAASDAEAEAERLAAEGFIKAETVKLINFREVRRFFTSDLYRRMRSAKDNGRLFRREYRFNVELDAADFATDGNKKTALQNESLLVQGVIDCFFEEEDGTVTVADYKTDRVGSSDNDIAAFADRHRLQLGYYKTAVERISLMSVGRCELYSFCLGRSVAL